MGTEKGTQYLVIISNTVWGKPWLNLCIDKKIVVTEDAQKNLPSKTELQFTTISPPHHQL